MPNKQLIAMTIAALILSACSSSPTPKKSQPVYTKDTNALNILINQISDNIQDIWGSKEVLIAGPKDYVQYSEDLQTRVHINFVSGVITIETLETDAKPALYAAITSTLLLAEPVDLLNSQAIHDSTQEPFLYKQVVDNMGEAIRWPWRANRFADYLLANQLKTRQSGGKQIAYVTINLVANHVDERAHKFLPLVKTAAQNYRLDEALILAIMKVESNYNPFAVSRSDALGLMQVQQHTAGRDLYSAWGKSGEPSRSFLLEPKNNIDMGSAYLAMIRDRYLVGIRNPISMKYAMITSYNGGAGSVLMTFSKDRSKAVDEINRLSPEQVYQKLTSDHASAESRNYLIKVTNIMGK
ncbi:membrane-bound lytic murein transglycosylase MltC [Utexia brackfieldae]|uniref:membrane-bound lytic murein transglycosylase MltC n=1 Tax=Utexia brackfieldae TaxID=3074108 RepID=UPI00370D88C6